MGAQDVFTFTVRNSFRKEDLMVGMAAEEDT
jgi:hypothetical protein